VHIWLESDNLFKFVSGFVKHKSVTHFGFEVVYTWQRVLQVVIKSVMQAASEKSGSVYQARGT
jgi:hypothetical protein